MGSDARTSNLSLGSALRGRELFDQAIGKSLRAARRHVRLLRNHGDPLGDGVTELDFGDLTVCLKPGPNDDFIVVEEGQWTPDADSDQAAWTTLDPFSDPPVGECVGSALNRVFLYSDGVEDIAVKLDFQNNAHFVVVLQDSDLIIASDLSALPHDDRESFVLTLREQFPKGPQ